MIEWPSKLIKAGNWTPVQWFSKELVNIVHELENSAWLESVGLRHVIGPGGRGVVNAFEKSSKDQHGAVPMFWSISSKIRQTMRSTPDEWFCAKSDKSKLAEKYWARRSHVLIAVRYDTINSRLSALWSAQASIGTGWVSVAVDDDRRAKALVAWWNSTPARLMLMNRRDRKLTYPKWSLKQLRSVGVPKPNNPAWDLLAEAWEEVCDTIMLPLCEAEHCVARRVIDNAAAKVLGIEGSQVADWRRHLAAEPTITNKPVQFG